MDFVGSNLSCSRVPSPEFRKGHLMDQAEHRTITQVDLLLLPLTLRPNWTDKNERKPCFVFTRIVLFGGTMSDPTVENRQADIEARNQYSGTVRLAKSQHDARIKQKVMSLPNGTRSFWTLAKQIGGNFSRSTFSPITSADETFATASKDKAEDLEAITAWGCENIVEFNASKAQYCKLSNKRCPGEHSVLMNNQVLPRSHSFKLLGVSITENMIWHEHVLSIETAAGKKLGYLFRARKYFSPSYHLTLYKA
nr:unnamed protein product [Callosobruchus chinensis]